MFASAEAWGAIYSALPAETKAFLIAIAVLTVAFHVRFTARSAGNGPTILTTLGIFATFIGIALGLSEFDTANVQASVPALLTGLKTAFWASVAGVGGALTLKIRDHALGHRLPEGHAETSEVTAADLVGELRHVQRALVGSEDGSIISQLKLSRQDANDRLDALRLVQQEGLQKLSEMGSKAIIEGLRDVIRDFNSKISEQFGDNFKELNAAVGQLLVWQHQYKTHIESTTQSLSQIQQLVAKGAQDYSTVVDRSESFSRVAHDLGLNISALESQKEHLTRLATGLAQLLQAASGSLPEVEKKIVDLTTQLTNAVSENQRTVGAALTDSARQTTELVSKTKDSVTVLDKALSDQLTKSLESLGRQLATLSERFVQDYTPLTENLRRLVEAGRVVN